MTATAQEPKQSVRERLQQFRPSVVTGGAPIYPLAVLFGLNAVDELDREAFAVLLPNIRDYLGLNIAGILTIISLIGGAVLLLEIPLAHYSDRRSRTRIATGRLRHLRPVLGRDRLHRQPAVAVLRPRRHRARPRGQRGHPPGAAVRLLRHQRPPGRLRVPQRRQLRRPVHRAGGRRVRRPHLRLPLALHHLRRPHADPHGPRLPPARPRPREPGAAGDGRRRAGDPDRGGAGVVLGGVADPVAGEDPPAHLHRPADHLDPGPRRCAP